jgi:hypothetical protein
VNLCSDNIILGDTLVEVDIAKLSNYTTFVGTLESGGTCTMYTDFTPDEAGETPITLTLNYLEYCPAIHSRHDWFYSNTTINNRTGNNR